MQAVLTSKELTNVFEKSSETVTSMLEHETVTSMLEHETVVKAVVQSTQLFNNYNLRYFLGNSTEPWLRFFDILYYILLQGAIRHIFCPTAESELRKIINLLLSPENKDMNNLNMQRYKLNADKKISLYLYLMCIQQF